MLENFASPEEVAALKHRGEELVRLPACPAARPVLPASLPRPHAHHPLPLQIQAALSPCS